MVNSDGLYNWQSAPTDQVTQILALVDSPDNIHHHVGVCIYSSAAKTGGQLLFHAGRSHCSFIPTIDRRGLSGASELTDTAWYLNKLVPPLLSIGLMLSLGVREARVCETALPSVRPTLMATQPRKLSQSPVFGSPREPVNSNSSDPERSKRGRTLRMRPLSMGHEPLPVPVG